MAGLLGFQPVPGATACRLARAQAWIERKKGLATEPCGPHAAKVRRKNGTGARAATGPCGWLVSAGTWHHPELGRDDNAALLARLTEDAAGVLDEIDGFYAIAWFHTPSETLTVALDHLGRHHIYFVEAPEGVYVGTSPAALAVAAGAPPDPLGVWELLACGTSYEERSPFAGIRRMTGGRRYRFRRGRLESATALDHHLFPPHGPAEGLATAEDLAEACQASFGAFVPPGQRILPDLTGGRDSRLLVGLLLEAGYRFEVTVTGDAGNPEVDVARRVARRLGLAIHVVPSAALDAARSSLPGVLLAAARVEGGYDAIEYAGIAAVHERHAGSFDMSLNGSGGEVARWYSWNTSRNRRLGDPVRALMRRFGATPPPFMAREHQRQPSEHFRGVIQRALAGRGADPIRSHLDHCYLNLRMQCWQGALSTASSERWLCLAPFLLQRTLAVVYSAPERDRSTSHLVHRLFRRLPAPIARVPLSSGYPAVPPPFAAWRNLPGIRRTAARMWKRGLARLGWQPPDAHANALVRALMASGGSDFLRPQEMALGWLLDDRALGAFLDRARTEGAVPPALLGRLISLEWAAREACGG